MVTLALTCSPQSGGFDGVRTEYRAAEHAVVADDTLNRLCAEIGPAREPTPDRYRRSGCFAVRLVCRECFHVTNAVGRKSHQRNIGHFEFDKVCRDDLDAYIENLLAHGLPPEGTG